VLEAVERLTAEGSAVIDDTGPYWVCFASEQGLGKGATTLEQMNGRARRYLRKAARWILAQPFGGMMAGI